MPPSLHQSPLTIKLHYPFLFLIFLGLCVCSAVGVSKWRNLAYFNNWEPRQSVRCHLVFRFMCHNLPKIERRVLEWLVLLIGPQRQWGIQIPLTSQIPPTSQQQQGFPDVVSNSTSPPPLPPFWQKSFSKKDIWTNVTLWLSIHWKEKNFIFEHPQTSVL
jgi:hypothetical protein